MKCTVSTTACVLSVLFAVGCAAPLLPGQFSASTNLQIGGGSTTGTSSTPSGGGGLTNILSDIDIPGLLRGVNSLVKLVGVFCPPLSQVLDNVIQNVTSTAFRVFGRLILRQGGLGGGGGGSGGSSGSGQRVNVVLPTYPPDEDEEYEDDAEETSEDVDIRIAGASSTSTTSTTTEQSSGSSSITTETSDTVVNTTSTLYTSPANEANAISKRHTRVARAINDQQGAESAPQPADDFPNVDTDDADRNKRYSPFGGGLSAGSAGGSGNFLFDIIRNTADRAARTAGTVYRMVAGTENWGWGLTATSETSQTIYPSIASPAGPSAKLVAGSGATEETDEKANAPGGVAEIDIAKTADGYTEGIPGPITRLFVLANRGLANLVQDLILRLAQTSERIVNFKARLITALI